jgi:hypothetical protein
MPRRRDKSGLWRRSHSSEKFVSEAELTVFPARKCLTRSAKRRNCLGDVEWGLESLSLLEQRRSLGTSMNRGFSLFQGEMARHHLKNDHSAFWEVRTEGSIPDRMRKGERCVSRRIGTWSDSDSTLSAFILDPAF